PSTSAVSSPISTPAVSASATPLVTTLAALAPSSTPSATPSSTPTPKPTPTPTQTPIPATRSLSGFVAFVSDRFDHPELYLYDADRGEVIQWTNDDAPKRNPAWAPDGRT